jgi:DNA anti-recombination protein RmuC
MRSFKPAGTQSRQAVADPAAEETRSATQAHHHRQTALPGETEECLLPIDAKFPIEDYERLQAASEIGDIAAVEEASKALETRKQNCSRRCGGACRSAPNVAAKTRS